MSARTRILIADEHEVIRAGIRATFGRLGDADVVGEAADGPAAVKLCGELAPDVVMIDVSIPSLSGIEATRQMVAANPKVRVIVCCADHEQRFLEQALRAGACGYLLKDSPASEVAVALRCVQRGDVYLSPKAAEVVLRSYIRTTSTSQAPRNRLSPRERDVLQLVVDGKTNREIGDRLKISVKTVEAHRAQLMDKLQLYSVAELTKYAIREGLTTLEI